MNVIPDVPHPMGNDLNMVREWALAVMASFGLGEWEFTFTKGKRTLGVCYEVRRIIGLSAFLVQRNGPEAVKGVLLHEIAHALTPGHGHDEAWRAMARRIGATPERCDSDADMPAGRWRATCGGCGSKFRRHRRPRRMAGWFCKSCGRTGGKLEWRLVQDEVA